MPDTDNAFELIRNMNAWRMGKFGDFLHFGTMKKPENVKAENKVELYSGGRVESMEPFYTAKYGIGDEEIQFIVNYTDDTIKIKLPENKSYTVYTDPSGENRYNAEGEVKINKRSVIAIA